MTTVATSLRRSFMARSWQDPYPPHMGFRTQFSLDGFAGRPAPRRTKTPALRAQGLGFRQEVNAQALGRLPWFAPFFLRARRLRPVLPMVCSFKLDDAPVSQIPGAVRESG